MLKWIKSRMRFAEAVPELVHTISELTSSLHLECIRKNNTEVPSTSPIIITLLRNELIKLHDFLRHYRSLGVKKIVAVDNNSSDGTFEFLRSQEDIDLYRYSEKYTTEARNVIAQKIIETYGIDRWYLLVDGDEQVVFDQCGRRAIEELAMEMEGRGILRVRGVLVDMYSDRPVGEPGRVFDSPLCMQYPFFDADTYLELKSDHAILVTGGPRMRVFGRKNPDFRPLLTKYPLFKAEKGDILSNSHYFWPYRKNLSSACFLGILHFKFLPDFGERITRAIKEGCYWNDSFEYRIYAESLAENPTLTCMSSSAVRYTGPDDLISAGVIDAVGWA